MSETTKIGLPEVDLGLFACSGGVFRLPKIIVQARAAEFMLTGKKLAPNNVCSWSTRLYPTAKPSKPLWTGPELLPANRSMQSRSSKKLPEICGAKLRKKTTIPT
jgi:enoyl-CoA hydratase/carnithine racemase